MVEFYLPWPPSVNSLYATYKGRRIKSKRGRQYVIDVRNCILESGLSGSRFDSPVTIELTMSAPTNRKYDVSNHLKAYEDALVQAGMIEDDHLIEYGHIKKAEISKGGYLFVRIIPR